MQICELFGDKYTEYTVKCLNVISMYCIKSVYTCILYPGKNRYEASMKA